MRGCFFHTRRSTSGESLPSWIISKGPVYLKRHVRQSKYDPLVEEVEILDAIPKYAHIQLADGRATTVSLKHLARKPPGDTILATKDDTPNVEMEGNSSVQEQTMDIVRDSQQMPVQQEFLRKSTRKRNTPAYLDDYVC